MFLDKVTLPKISLNPGLTWRSFEEPGPEYPATLHYQALHVETLLPQSGSRQIILKSIS